LEATARELAAETNRRIVPLAADVTSKEQVDRMVAEAAQQLGSLHILVNSGSAPGGSTTATGPIETVIDEDLLQDFKCSSTKGNQTGAKRYTPSKAYNYAMLSLATVRHFNISTGGRTMTRPFRFSCSSSSKALASRSF
jgi:NAD(P)-dependent dehydrogenase (short-subunit alcohol dehydrogenase family)